MNKIRKMNASRLNRAEKLLTGLLPLHTAVFLFGVAGLFGKWIDRSPLLIVFGRLIFASITLGLVLGILRRAHPEDFSDKNRWKQGRAVLLIILCGGLLCFHWVAFFQAIQISSVAIGLLGFATAPIFAVMLEPLWFKEPFHRSGLVAALVSLVGILLIIPRWHMSDNTLLGILWGMGAGVSFALISLLNRGLRKKFRSVELAFYQDLAAAILLAPFLTLFWEPLSGEVLALLIILGVVCTALAHGLYIQALSTVTARGATLVSNLEPVYGIILAAFLLGEWPATRTLGGGALIMVSVIWISLDQKSLGQPAKNPE